MHVFPFVQSASRRHSTQPPPLQTGAWAGQSMSVLHSTQTPSALQTCALLQSELTRHSTQLEIVVLHTGVLPEHWVLVVQPATQVNVRGLQMGRAAPQSALSRQATHWPRGAKHRGNDGVGAQSASAAQATHWSVTARQILSLPRQSAASLQPTQAPAPAPALQIGEAAGHDDESVQAA